MDLNTSTNKKYSCCQGDQNGVNLKANAKTRSWIIDTSDLWRLNTALTFTNMQCMRIL